MKFVKKLLTLLFFSFLLSACGTMQYQSEEYPLRAGLIQPIKMKGNVQVINNQTSNQEMIVYSYMGTKLKSSIKEISTTFVNQTKDELKKNGQIIDHREGKSLAIKVNSLKSTYTNLMFWRSSINFEVTLGNGQKIPFIVKHTSGVLIQDLNGCIAEGVMTLLNDKRVREYLAQE